MKENIIRVKSFELAKEIVVLYQLLTKEKREYILSKQLLRSGTSVGANVAEGLSGQSKKDFCYRLNIAHKEARETLYWLTLLKASGYISDKKGDPVIFRCDEVIRILTAILKTATLSERVGG